MPEALPTVIVLVGETGVGKSTLGPAIARHFGMPFFDVDDEFGELPGDKWSTSSGILLRRQIIENLLSQPPVVIATGFEDFLPEIAQHQIKSSSLSVYLEGDMEERHGETVRVYRHGGTVRSLFPGLSPAERASAYRLADLTVVVADLIPAAAADRVIAAIRGHLRCA